MRDVMNLLGRVIVASLFIGGFAQKLGDPVPVMAMIEGIGLPGWVVWGVALFNLIAGLGLIFGPWVSGWAFLLAGYCVFTSYFHWQLRVDPWQITIVAKNWAIAGGLLILAAQGPGRFAFGVSRGQSSPG